jgi:hypothetical protein
VSGLLVWPNELFDKISPHAYREMSKQFGVALLAAAWFLLSRSTSLTTMLSNAGSIGSFSVIDLAVFRPLQ